MLRPQPPLETGELPVPMRGEAFVYRMYDENGDVLYVGVADDVSARVGKHHQERLWFPRVRRIVWERHPSRADAEHAERYFIAQLVPEHNIRDNGRRVLAAQMGHRKPYPGEAWQRLGQSVRAERARTRRAQKEIAAAASVSMAEYRALERGESTRYERIFLERVEAALAWKPGSFEAVLAGGEPARLTDAELFERALTAHRVSSPGDRI